MTTLKNCQKELRIQLRHAKIQSPDLETRLLIGHTLKIEPVKIISCPEIILSKSQKETLMELAQRRCKGEPLARILGQKEFYGLNFYINEATLIPRPDTEVLVETAIKWLKNHKNTKICDIGTGSGAILISILKHIPDSQGIGTDISLPALEIASKNRTLHNLENICLLKETSILEGITSNFDLILSNPPYIPTAIIPTLDTEVKNYDPITALDGGNDGCHFYRLIAHQAKSHLKSEGILMVEIGQGMEKSVNSCFFEQNWKSAAAPVSDLSGTIRVLCFTLKR